MWPCAATPSQCCGDADAQAAAFTHLYSPFAPAFDFNLRALARPASSREGEIFAHSLHCHVSREYSKDSGNAMPMPLQQQQQQACGVGQPSLLQNQQRNTRQNWPRDSFRTRMDCHYHHQVHLGGGNGWRDICDSKVHQWAKMRATPQIPLDACSSGSFPTGSPSSIKEASPACSPHDSPAGGFFSPSHRFATSRVSFRDAPRSVLPVFMVQMGVDDRIDPDMIVFGEVIGEGSFGSVYRGLMTGQDVAIKRMKLSLSLTPEEYVKAIRKFENEVTILKTLRHPNIVTYLGLVPFPAEDNIFVDEEDDDDDDSMDNEEEEDATQLLSYCIVTEFCPNGTLMDLLSNNKNLSWSRYLQIAKDIVSGLHFLHFKHIIHRDLKPGNVLMTECGKAKLADFGLAHVKESGDMASRPYGVCGTKCFVAPEVLRNEPYSFSADIFSLGVVLCQMVSGSYPFESSSSLCRDSSKVCSSELSYEARILAGERPQIPSHTLPDLKALIESCWSADPERRPPVSHVMKWLDSIARSLNIRLQTSAGNLFNDVPIRSRKFFEDLQARIAQANAQLQQLKSVNAKLELQLKNSEKLRKVQLTCVKLKYERMLLEKENEAEIMRRNVSRLSVALHRSRSRSSADANAST